MIKQKHYIYISIFLLVSIFVFGFTHRVVKKENIIWANELLGWENFTEVSYIEDGFHAYIYSNIYCPKKIIRSNSMVYAYMNPNKSGRLKDSVFDIQLRIHEQYHFNITEYHARLLRKDIVEIGEKNLTKSKIRFLYNKYEKQRENMQERYDRISNHNVETEKQRYWELKIDDLLRKTSYYKNLDIYSYYDFTREQTQFFKHIYFNIEYEVLTSYPINHSNLLYGKSYEVIKENNNVTVKFYKNGKLSNGGYFKTAITKIIHNKDESVEVHYYNPNEVYNYTLPHYISKRRRNEDNDKEIYYLNEKGARISSGNIYEIKWKSLSDGRMYSSYFNKDKQSIRNDDGVYHEKRSFDKKGRTIRVESFDENSKPMNDKYFSSIYELVYDNDHKIIQYKIFDKDENYATSLNEYYTEYSYDERGNEEMSFNLNENGDKTEDKKGVCTYEYTYDLYDKRTSVKRYNKDKIPVLGIENYFHHVIEYDSLERKKFEAYYHPEYILKFSDSKWGATKFKYPNDSLIVEFNVDVYNDALHNNNGVSTIKKYVNKKKEVVKEVYLKTDQHYAITENQIVQYTNKYDNNGNMIEQRALDSLGNSKYFEADVATIRWQYDDSNNKIKTTYFNKHSKLANANQKVTYNVYSYNKRNQMIERKNYNKNMKPTLFNGIYKTRLYYNSIGKNSLIKEYDVNSILKKGASITTYTYNKYGNDTKDEFYNSKHQRIKNNNGVSIIKYHYDKKQRYLGYSYYDEYDRPVESLEGYHKFMNTLNNMGEIVKVSTYGKDGLLIDDSAGIAEYEYKVEKSGLTSRIKYYNKNHQLVENSDGAAEIYYKPNLNGLYYLDKQLNAKGEEVKENLSTIS